MSLLHVKYLLVGGGVAASEAVRAIRARDGRGDLLLVGQEINRPYDRTSLSKNYLQGKVAREELFTLSADWFVQHDVLLRTGNRAVHLDTARSTVALASGEEISFDRLLLATGALPNSLRLPGADLPNLFYLRSLDDAEHLVHAIDKARREGRKHNGGRGRAIVIGGGLLGTEIASSLASTGIAVDLSIVGAHPWRRIVGDASGRSLTRHLESHGIRLHTSPAARLEGDGRVQRVLLADGTSLDCDFAVAAVGTHVNLELIRSTPIAAENAILTDSHCATNVPNVFAAGDCAAILDPLFDKHRRPGPYDTARETGQIAGANLAGANVVYDGLSRFDSELFGLGITGWGESRLVDRRLIRSSGNGDSLNFAEIGIAADGRIAQVVAFGPCREDRSFPNLVQKRVRVNGNEQALSDPTQPLPREE